MIQEGELFSPRWLDGDVFSETEAENFSFAGYWLTEFINSGSDTSEKQRKFEDKIEYQSSHPQQSHQGQLYCVWISAEGSYSTSIAFE